MGFNSYINYLKPNFYNKIKVLIHLPLKKLFYVAGFFFFFFLPNCTKYALFNRKEKLAVKAILNNLRRHSHGVAVPLSIGRISFIYNYDSVTGLKNFYFVHTV